MRFLFLIIMSTCSLYICAQPGSLDSTFGTNGQLEFSLDERTIINDLEIGTDGKLYLCGSSVDYNSTPSWDGFMARLHPDGSLDESFANGGIVKFNGEEHCSMFPLDLHIMENGEIILAVDCSGNFEGIPDPLYGRFLSNGQPHYSFGGNGLVRPSYDLSLWSAHSQFVNTEGYMYLIGKGIQGIDCNYYGILRIDKKAKWDTSFHVCYEDLNKSNNVEFQELYPSQDSGFYVMENYFQDDFGYKPYLLKFMHDGSIDNSFSEDGILLFNHSKYEQLSQIAFEQSQYNSNAYVSCYTKSYPGPGNSSLFRFDQFDGTHDSIRDRIELKSPTDSLISCSGIEEQTDEKILVSGLEHHREYGDMRVIVARYTKDLELDSDFGENGFYVHDISGLEEQYDWVYPQSVSFHPGNGGIYLVIEYHTDKVQIIKLQSGLETDIKEPKSNTISWSITNPQHDLDWEYTLPSSLRSDYTIQVFNIRGEQMYKKVGFRGERRGTLALPAGLTSGLYLILLEAEEMQSVRRVMYQPGD